MFEKGFGNKGLRENLRNHRVGSKVHCADDLPDSALSTKASYESKNDGVQNKKSSYNECELPSKHSSGPTKGNAEIVSIQNETLPSRFPVFHASEQGPWFAMICYEACVRLCVHALATDSFSEASYFLINDCVLIRNAFGLQNFFLRSEEELLGNRPSTLVTETTTPKFKRSVGKIKLQVGRIKMGSDPQPRCNMPSLKHEIVSQPIAELNSTLSSGWKAVKRVHVAPRVPLNGSISEKSLAYMRACAQYLKQVTKALQKEFVTSLNGPRSLKAIQEKFSCTLRLKSCDEEDQIKTQPESGETFVFLPDSIGDDLIVEVRDSKGQFCGRVLAQLAAIADEPKNEKLKWWAIYHEPEHERIGRIQLHINYSSSLDEKTKCGLVAETPAYDLLLEVAMKAENFQRRNLIIKGPWHWLLTQFASYYGISDAYTKLRYLSYVMDVASPTKDCLDLIYDFLSPILTKGNHKALLSHQENRLLGEIDEQVQKILASTFENYKSLDEYSFSGIKNVFEPPSGTPAPALTPAIKLYCLLNDLLIPEAQLRLCRYFQAASKKRSRRYILETNDILHEYHSEGAQATSCQKMKSLILSLKKEISTDIAINNCNVIPRYIDLPNLSAAIYSVDLFNRLREYVTAWPPPSPSPPVVDLVIATADFEADLSRWNIKPIKGGFTAIEIFNPYITAWIEEKGNALYEFCKSETAKACSEIQGLTSPFVEEMYVLLDATLDDFDLIIRRWPEYAVSLERVVADSERVMIEALEKQFSEILSPLKDSKTCPLKYVQRLTKIGTSHLYSVPKELGVFLNSVKTVLDNLRPSIENRFEVWNYYLSDIKIGVLGEQLSEVTVLLRSKFRSYMQALVEKLAENMRMQSHMKMKNIIHDLKRTTSEADVRNRMQSLKDLLDETMYHLHGVLSLDVFVLTCKGIWDRMGQDVLCLLEGRKDKVNWHKGLTIAVDIIDEIFVTQMLSLLGDSVREEDLEAPRSMMELQSILYEDRKGYYY
ncbi:hypothetical protein EUTSA_v10015247mg [Eutrema salsugineum]|uniref:Uncharacterized protein n=1 Tax=Eutrema salsugineum TaxID=72664 RepID=V4KSV6_EUTSA|nr:hypothetical protein EUTSA_v10015247mg [Eutrema salsugineum]